MQKLLAVIGVIWLAGCGSTWSPTGDPLITGKYITAPNERGQDVGSLPMNLMATPDGRFVISSDMGYYQSLWSISTSTGRGVSHVDFSNREASGAVASSQPVIPGGEAANTTARQGTPKSNGLYYGLASSRDGKTIYAAQGAHDSIAVLDLSPDGKLTHRDEIPATKQRDFPAGLATDDAGRLYVTNNAAGEFDPWKLTASVAIYDPATKKELGRYTFSESYEGTSNFPLGIAVLRDGSKSYVASERDDAVYILDTHDAKNPKLAGKLETGDNPAAVLLTRDERTLFVGNSQSDTISVVDTKSDRINGTILLRPKMARELCGVSPVALALSPDQKTLYAALGDMNAVAVVDIAKSELRGYIPTGWYPSALAVTRDGKHLLVANAKGWSVRNPNNRPDRHDPSKKKMTPLTLLEGNVCASEIPSGKNLEQATRQVLKENRLDELEKPRQNPLAPIGLQAGKIKHVIYIIKENRTYDQILSDLPQGNGDKSLLLFGRDITPNQHALAERFVLLDNLYACGEVSGDGWDWSTQGMANAYVIRNIQYNYSGRGRRFDFEGMNNGYPVGGAPARDANGKLLWKYEPFHKEAKPIPDVANTGRNIWDAAREAGISIRNYGFFMDFGDRTAGFVGGPDNLPAVQGLMPGGHDLDGITDVDFRRFDMDYPDSDAPSFYFKQTGDKNCLWKTTKFGKDAMPSRFSEWNREFQLMLAKDPTGGAVPAFILLRLPTDHTTGARSGAHTPPSYVADNDHALGQVVETVSKSPIWKSTAIVVIEDDAQSGVDHVDAHRTIGFVISPWIKRASVDHHFYNTDSMLKTIELLLGLKPLSQYDAVADPIMNWDTKPTNDEPYEAIRPPKELIAAVNPTAAELQRSDPRREMALESDKMNFVHADAAPARELDEIVWHMMRGQKSPMPVMRGVSPRDADDDD